MPSIQEQVQDFALGLAKYGSAWWMPFLLLAVSIANSLTGGLFIWCLGALQGVLFPVVVLSNGKPGLLLGPLMLTIGSSIAAITYMQLMSTGGADALLTQTGAKDSKWLAMAQEWAVNYGALGLFILQVSPIPIPTAVMVVTGSLAKIDEYTVFAVVIGSKFVQLLLGSIGMQYATEGLSLEEYLRQQFKGEEKEKKKD